MDMITKTFKKINHFLIKWAEKIYEYRNKSGNKGTY